MVFIAGLMWCLTGIIFSYAARKSVAIVTLMVTTSIFMVAISWTLLPDYGVLRSAGNPGLKKLILFMLLSGLTSGVGALSMLKAMRSGHHGVIWCTAQASLAFPFLTGLLIFGEPFIWHKAVGVGSVLASLVAFGAARAGDAAENTGSGPFAWFALALLAFLCLGLGQSFMTVPSHWSNWTDTANLRLPVFYLGCAMTYGAVFIRRRSLPDRRTIRLAALLAANSIVGFVLFLTGLDMLKKGRLVSIGYPLGVGTCIVVFTLYSIFVLRERCTRRHVAGLLLGVIGIILIALPTSSG